MISEKYICGRCGEILNGYELDSLRDVLDVIDGRAYIEMLPCCPYCRSTDIDTYTENNNG